MRFCIAILCLLAVTNPAAGDPINAVLGDASWQEAYGTSPSDDEVLRIQTHLRYVLARLRAQPATSRRTAALDALERYIERGVFPRRTGDPYLGRRPRFIDDRGVHCAVGQLIAETGHPELARAIAAQYEYAYVPDIETPGLHAWAARTGFTLEELAQIQPSYGFKRVCDHDPGRMISSAKEQILLECAASHAPLAEVKLVLEATETSVTPAWTASTASSDPFAKCFAAQATHVLQREYRGATCSPFVSASITLALPTPQQVLERQVQELELDDACWPRPGPLARSAALKIVADADGLAVRVTTTPENRAVSACLAKNVRIALSHIGPGAWQLRVATERHLPPRVTEPHSTGRPPRRSAIPRGIRPRMSR